LLRGGTQRPTINGRIDQIDDGIGDIPSISGWNGTEYGLFLELPLFIGGKNGPVPLTQPGRVGTAYLAYDCNYEIFCGAAHLDAGYMTENPKVEVRQKDDESWIRFGDLNSDPKLKQSDSDEFKYIGKPLRPSFTIGYEGCWNTSAVGVNITNNFVEVHFVTKKGDTISTGKPAANGAYICLEPLCDSPVGRRLSTFFKSEATKQGKGLRV
jgi:hypothetical protein